MAFWIRKNGAAKGEGGKEPDSGPVIRKKKEDKKAPTAKRLDNLRIPHQMPIVMKSLGTRNEYSFVTKDLSSNGAFVVCPDLAQYPFQQSSTLLDCVVDLGTQGSSTESVRIRFLAKIARIVDEPQSDGTRSQGFGIRIVQISGDQRHLLENFIGLHGTPEAAASAYAPYTRAEDAPEGEDSLPQAV